MTIVNLDKSNTFGWLITEAGDYITTEIAQILTTEAGSFGLNYTNKAKNNVS